MRKALLLAVALTGCASADRVNLPDGTPGYTIGCGGQSFSWNNCYQKAGEVCPSGYQILDKTGEQGFQAGVSPYGGGAQTVEHRGLLIRCK